jgi:hypothetical protein
LPCSCQSGINFPTPRFRLLRHVTRLVVPLVIDNPASRGSSHGSSSTTPPCAGSSSTTSPPPRVRVPRHIARLVAPLVDDFSASRRLVVDYSAPRRLVIDYFASAARPGASAHHAARRAARRRLLRLAQARRRLFRLYRASGCLGTSRGSSHGSSRRSSSTTPPHAGSSSTTSPPSRVRVPRHVARLVTQIAARLVVDYSASRRLVVDNSASRRLVVDYFASAVRPGASARRAARHADRRTARRRLICYAARLGASARLAAQRLSSTTSPTLRDRVPRHIAWLVAPLVVDYFAYTARPGASARRAARHAAHHRILRAPRLRLVATLAPLQPRRASRLLVSRQNWLYFEYAARRHDVIFRSHRIDHSSRLVSQSSRERQSRPQQLVGINSD